MFTLPYIVNSISSNKKKYSSYDVFNIDIDVPKSNGMHNIMMTKFTIRRKRQSNKKNTTINILVVYDVPSGCYIDPFELEQRHYWNLLIQSISHSTAIRIHTYNSSIDTEIIAENASNSIIGIELLSIPIDLSNAINNYIYYNVSFNLPIHLRYHLPSYNQTYANVNIKYPTIYINDDDVNTINTSHDVTRVYDRTHIGNKGNADSMGIDLKYNHVKCLNKTKYTYYDTNRETSSSCNGIITLRMPLGSSHHAIFVDIITLFTITITTIAILLALFRRGSTKFMKNA